MTKEIDQNITKSQNLLREKNFNDAEIILLKNLKISNNNFETYFLLGSIAGIKKKFEEAENYLKKALNIKSSHITSNLNLAIILKKLNKKQDAIKYFKKVTDLDKNNVESLCGIAQIYEEELNFENAKIFLKKALDINPSHHVANHNYGKLLLKLNKHREGLKFIEKVSGMIKFKSNNFEIV